MMITRHAFRGETDLPRISAIIENMPLSCVHVIDLPWRLSSPAINESHDAVLWEDEHGQVLAFAAWQYYWATLDFFIMPGPEAQSIEVDLFAWADERFGERDRERGYPLPYWVEFWEDDHERQRLVEAHGFLLDTNDYYVLLQHDLRNLSSVPTVPDGFQLRTLAGEQETVAYAELHRTAFESTSMTAAWRARTLRAPHYRPELDLVIVAPDGSLAGFCVGWFEPARHVAQIEPIGVDPRFHRRGFGRILLLEMLRHFQAYGANSVIIEPSGENTAIVSACKSVGFQLAHTIRRKGKLISQPLRAQ